MKFASKTLVAFAAASALVAAPAMAAGNPAASLSVVHVRAGAPVAHGSKIAEGGTATLINVGILAVLSAVVLLATTGGGDDDSDSN